MSEVNSTATAPAQAASSGGAPAEAQKPVEAKAETVLGGAGAEQKTPDVAATQAAPVVPEKYDLKLPEGSKLEASFVDQLSAFAKEQGLNQAQAQKLLDREHASRLAFETAHKAAQDKALADYRAGLMTTLEKDPEIGGAKLAENAEYAKRFVAQFGSEQLKKDLNESGLGNHPELIRMLAKAGKQFMAEDRSVHGNPVTPIRSREERFFEKSLVKTKKE